MKVIQSVEETPELSQGFSHSVRPTKFQSWKKWTKSINTFAEEPSRSVERFYCMREDKLCTATIQICIKFSGVPQTGFSLSQAFKIGIFRDWIKELQTFKEEGQSLLERGLSSATNRPETYVKFLAPLRREEEVLLRWSSSEFLTRTNTLSALTQIIE